ncbi:hypothetical protein QTO34_002207 [Cnephaeus nilssonii]|uniref:DDE-1 domain-containing protein n=1 Tax=Cnephaeus nilssonii TaxID=3371016 RepID=A0AA40LN65_CNENI|nr:hypothetical protein QTO34_002207 [Eptesicus nilssonii]
MPSTLPSLNSCIKEVPKPRFGANSPGPLSDRVNKYFHEKHLSLGALLVMDKAPAHSPGLEAELEEEYGFIAARFLPPNTAHHVQPVDQSSFLTLRNSTKGTVSEVF